MVTSGRAHDIFAADVLYHKTCYNKFIRFECDKLEIEQAIIDEKGKKERVASKFIKLVQQRVLSDKKAFLLIDLLNDISDLSEEEGLEEPSISTTKVLRRLIESHFEEKISFHLVGKRSMVYSSDVNPCIYVAATLQGC